MIINGFILPDWPIEEPIEVYLASFFIPHLIKYLSNLQYLIKDKEGLDSRVSLLLIYENRVFEIQRNLTFFESKEFYGALGSGSKHCLSVLEYTKNSKKAVNRIKKAIKVASVFDNNTSAKSIVHELTKDNFKM